MSTFLIWATHPMTYWGRAVIRCLHIFSGNRSKTTSSDYKDPSSATWNYIEGHLLWDWHQKYSSINVTSKSANRLNAANIQHHGILCGLDHICDSIFETAVNLGRIGFFFFLSGPKHITVASVNHLSVYGKCTSVLIWKKNGGRNKIQIIFLAISLAPSHTGEWQVLHLSDRCPLKCLWIRVCTDRWNAYFHPYHKGMDGQIGAVNIANSSRIIHCQLQAKNRGKVLLFTTHNSGMLNDSQLPWQNCLSTSGTSSGWHRSGQVLEQDHTFWSHFNF